MITQSVVLEIREPGDQAWTVIGIAPVLDLPGYGIDAARRKLADSLARWQGAGFVRLDAETRFVLQLELTTS